MTHPLAIVVAALLFLVLVFCIMAERSPEGEEIPGIGFVRRRR